MFAGGTAKCSARDERRVASALVRSRRDVRPDTATPSFRCGACAHRSRGAGHRAARGASRGRVRMGACSMTAGTIQRDAAARPSLPYLLPRHEVAGLSGAPVVLVLGGISSTCHVTSTESDRQPGRWEDIVGAGRAVDTNHFRALGVEFLDGGRAIDGRPRRVVTTHDQADAIAALLDCLEVRRLRAVVGASYGGMVGLSLAERYPKLLDRLIVIGAAHVSHPLSTALRAIQRRIVSLGLETGRTREGVILARALATTTYRSANEFEERFGEDTALRQGTSAFAVEDYLVHGGERFASVCMP